MDEAFINLNTINVIENKIVIIVFFFQTELILFRVNWFYGSDNILLLFDFLLYIAGNFISCSFQVYKIFERLAAVN